MRLFESPKSTDLAPAQYGESHFGFLQRSGRVAFVAVRDFVERLFTEYPNAHQGDLATRLRKSNNNHFDAAFFELYVHALLLRLGYRLQVHPRAGNRGRRPDFLATDASGSGILVEAASIDEMSAEQSAEKTRLNSMYDAVNEIPCPDFFLHLQHFNTLTSPLPIRRLRHELTLFTKDLNYGELVDKTRRGDLRTLPRMVFIHDDFRLEISATPVSPENRGRSNHRPIGALLPGSASWVNDRIPIRQKIRGKANHYGALRRPFLVAVNAAGRSVDHDDIQDALFGKEEYVFSQLSIDAGEAPRVQRLRDGAWMGPNGPHNRAVSGVLIVSSLLPWTIAVHEPVLYLNPWARYPIARFPAQITQVRLEGGH